MAIRRAVRGVIVGSSGVCLTCRGRSFLKLGTLKGVAPEEHWVASRKLLLDVCKSLMEVMQTKEGVTKMTRVNGLGEVEELETRHVDSWACCPACKNTSAQLFWLSVTDDDDHVVAHLVGPFCKNCLLRTSKYMESTDGESEEMKLYVVNVDTETLSKAQTVVRLDPERMPLDNENDDLQLF